MNILSFGTEQKLFDQGSRVYRRIFGYSFFAEKYYHFVFTKDSTVCRREDKNMIVVPVYGESRIVQILRLARLLQKENLKRKNLVVSAQDPFEIGFIAVIIAKLYRAKLLVQMHSDISTDNYKIESLRNRFQARVAKFVFAKADRIRVVSGRMGKFLVGELKIQEEKVTLLPIFSVLNVAQLEPKKDTKNIVMLCRVEKVKQIPLAVEAVGIVRQKTNIDYKLKIVGEGSQKKRLQEKYDGLPWVEWTAFTENVQKEYQSACCSLITSLYEGFAMTAIESISFGTPVAMTDVGCAGDVVREGVNGSITKDFTAEGIAQAIIQILNSNYAAEDLRESLKILGTQEEYLKKIKQIHTF